MYLFQILIIIIMKEMLRKNETYEDILYEPHFRYK